MNRSKYILVLYTLMTPILGMAKPPRWASENTLSRSGNFITVVCNNVGPTLLSARGASLDACIASASELLVSEVSFKALSVETEADASYHSEVAKAFKLQGLSCQPLEEFVEQGEGETYTVWNRCRFDTRATKVVPAEEPNHIASGSNRTDVDTSTLPLTKRNLQLGTFSPGSEQRVSIASVPMCDSIIVRGKKPRVIPCKRNPLHILVDTEDTELVFRAKSFKPKTIRLDGRTLNEIQVLFD